MSGAPKRSHEESARSSSSSKYTPYEDSPSFSKLSADYIPPYEVGTPDARLAKIPRIDGVLVDRKILPPAMLHRLPTDSRVDIVQGRAEAGKEPSTVEERDLVEAHEDVGENKLDMKGEDKFKGKDRKRKDLKHWDWGEQEKERVDCRSNVQFGDGKELTKEERDVERWGRERKDPVKDKERVKEREKDHTRRESWNGADKESNEKDLADGSNRLQELENVISDSKMQKESGSWKTVDKESIDRRKEWDVDGDRTEKHRRAFEKELDDGCAADAEGGIEREREVYNYSVQQRKRMQRSVGSPQVFHCELRFRTRMQENEGSQGKAEVSSVVYKVGECMQELIKLWKEYEASQAEKNSESSSSGPTLEIRIPAEHVTATNRQVRGGQLWGTDIYTDDSDLVAVLMHTGYCRPTASPPPPAIQELRATIRVLPPQDCYISTLRNNVRSRARGAAIGCSYRVERCCIMKKGGGTIDLEPRLTHTSTVEPTALASVAVERTLTTRAAASIRSDQIRSARITARSITSPASAVVMVVNARPLKRMKSRVMADLYDFLTFPSPADSVGGGAFRAKIRMFLSKHAMLPPPPSLFPHLMTWQILFRVGGCDAMEGAVGDNFLLPPAVVCLDVVEEDVARSRSIYCDQCRVVGWSGHPVCGKRYHFIIKSDGNSIGGYHKPCVCCGDVLYLSESKCKSCNLETNTDDVEDWVYSQLENTSHLLHGVVHSNGFGHLLRINGREGGSRFLSGSHIMDFWDRLCKLLGARKVSVMDVSKKYGLEYRLLHSVTRGHPWYGNWGYEFGAGSFALTLDSYNSAVQSLSGLPLSMFFSQHQNENENQKQPPSSSCSRLLDIISHYQSLSERDILTVKDLLSFVLNLLHDARKNNSSSKHHRAIGTSGAVFLPLWTRNDVDRVEEAMLRVLRAVSGANWVSWRALKGAVCKAGPPELLDYCFKELGGKTTVDGMVVIARLNPDTGAFECRLELGGVSMKGNTDCIGASVSSTRAEESLLQDLKYLYECMLHPRTMMDYVPQATRELAISSAEKLLDCKQFVKEYETVKMSNNSHSFTFLSCQVELVDEIEEISTIPPPELVILSPNATVADLKLEVSKAFQDVYLMFKRFHADELLGYGSVDECTLVKCLLGSMGFVRLRGRCHVKHGLSRFRMERGVERWTVDCNCGAKDDDGERMLACDVCGVWQHTRCSGISDSELVPARFVCCRCRTTLQTAKTGAFCKDTVTSKVGNSASGCVDKGLTAPDFRL